MQRLGHALRVDLHGVQIGDSLQLKPGTSNSLNPAPQTLDPKLPQPSTDFADIRPGFPSCPFQFGISALERKSRDKEASAILKGVIGGT